MSLEFRNIEVQVISSLIATHNTGTSKIAMINQKVHNSDMISGLNPQLGIINSIFCERQNHQ